MFATLFDFDGVLVDSEPAHLAAFNDVLAARGLAIDPGEYAERYLSLGDAEVFRAVLARGGRAASDEEVRALVREKSPRLLARFAGALRVFPGAAELLARRAARGPVGIVSGALRGEIELALEKMDARRSVAFIVSADDGGPSKPDPAPYLRAKRRLRQHGAAGQGPRDIVAVAGEGPRGIVAVAGQGPRDIVAVAGEGPRDIVAIEDATGGVRSAKAAGLRCVAVAHSYARQELAAAGADAVVDDLSALTDALLEGA